MKSAEEEGEIGDMPETGFFCTNEGEEMELDTVVAKNRDEVGGDIGENYESGRVDFEEENEELEVLTGSPLEFKSGLCQAHQNT